MMGFENLQVGDVVVRMLAGTLPMKLQVSDITDQLIICSAWQFDKVTGAEIDEELGWGPPPLMTGSYIDPPQAEHGVQRQQTVPKKNRSSSCRSILRRENFSI